MPAKMTRRSCTLLPPPHPPRRRQIKTANYASNHTDARGIVKNNYSRSRMRLVAQPVRRRAKLALEVMPRLSYCCPVSSSPLNRAPTNQGESDAQGPVFGISFDVPRDGLQ